MARNAGKPPHVKELGIATLDTRDIFCRNAPAYRTERLIRTQQFSTSNASKDFEHCDITDFQECVFAETFLVSQQAVPAVIKSCLQLQDTRSPGALRKVVLIGHSIKHDLNLLQLLGVDVHRIAPVVSLFDTHAMSRHLFGSQSELLNGASPWNCFTLAAALDHFGCSYNAVELHNAGNDATYTLHVMLALVIRHAEIRELTIRQTKNLKLVKDVARSELNGSYRWKPVRLSGFEASSKLTFGSAVG